MSCRPPLEGIVRRGRESERLARVGILRLLDGRMLTMRTIPIPTRAHLETAQNRPTRRRQRRSLKPTTRGLQLFQPRKTSSLNLEHPRRDNHSPGNSVLIRLLDVNCLFRAPAVPRTTLEQLTHSRRLRSRARFPGTRPRQTTMTTSCKIFYSRTRVCDIVCGSVEHSIVPVVGINLWI